MYCTVCTPEAQRISLVIVYIFLAVSKSNENNNNLILPTCNLIYLILLSDRPQSLSKNETNCCTMSMMTFSFIIMNTGTVVYFDSIQNMLWSFHKISLFVRKTCTLAVALLSPADSAPLQLLFIFRFH